MALTDIEDEDAAARIVESLINSFAAHSFRLDDTPYRLAMKVGIAMCPDDGAEAEGLFKNAGAALTKAKAGRDSYLFYAQRMTDTVAGRLGMENQLRQALEREEFVLHYQAKVNLATGQIVGAEALLRWNDPRTGLVPPARFIPVSRRDWIDPRGGTLGVAQGDRGSLEWRRSGLSRGPDRGQRVAAAIARYQFRCRYRTLRERG